MNAGAQLPAARDNERAALDQHTYNLKLIFLEASRRMLGRGILEDDRDFYFLSKEELFEHLGIPWKD